MYALHRTPGNFLDHHLAYAHENFLQVPQNGLSAAMYAHTTPKQYIPLSNSTHPEDNAAQKTHYVLATSPTSPTSPTGTTPLPAETVVSNQEGALSTVPWEDIITYNASGTIIIDVSQKTLHLRKEGTIQYATTQLNADYVHIDWPNHTVTAYGEKNPAGVVTTQATLIRDQETYMADSVCYNFQSQRAIAHKLSSKQTDSIWRANTIKKNNFDTFYADHAIYTTCDLTKPHFHVAAQKVKIIRDELIVSGPFRLYLNDIPTPLGFSFGIFHFFQRNGVIPPKYGGESEKGFGLENGGYYFKFKDYADLALRASLYSKGTSIFTVDANYKKRYLFGGNLSFIRENNINTQNTQRLQISKGWRLQWHHHTINNRYRSWNIDLSLGKGHITSLKKDYTTTSDYDASIQYTNQLTRCPLPYTFYGSARWISQQHDTNEIILPACSLHTINIYPFRREIDSKNRWYTNIYFRHDFACQNKLTYHGKDDLSMLNPQDWRKIGSSKKYGAIHTIPIQTNFKILHYFNLTPKLSYRERWYGAHTNYRYDHDTATYIAQKVAGFSRVYDWDASAKLQTIVYGNYVLGENTTVQAIRHHMAPELTLTYTPAGHGYWQTIQGQTFNKFPQAVYGSPRKDATAILAISLNNKLAMKINTRTEDAQVHTKKITLLEHFDWSTAYDFLANTHAWHDVTLKTHTTLFNKWIDIRFESGFDPYCYEPMPHTADEERQPYIRSNKLAWKHGQGLGHMKKASMTVYMHLYTGGNTQSTDNAVATSDHSTTTQATTVPYAPCDIPCQLYIHYDWRYTCPKPDEEATKIRSLGFEWQVNLTKKWTLTGKSAYDLTTKAWIDDATSISIDRDLHCWEMHFDWSPSGAQQTYKFSIGLKAPLLKDVKYSRTRTYPNY